MSSPVGARRHHSHRGRDMIHRKDESGYRSEDTGAPRSTRGHSLNSPLEDVKQMRIVAREERTHTPLPPSTASCERGSSVMVAYSRQISQARFSRELVYAKSSTSRWIASLSRKLSARWCPEGCYASAPLLRRPDPLAPVEESATRFPLACSSFLLYTPHATHQTRRQKRSEPSQRRRSGHRRSHLRDERLPQATLTPKRTLTVTGCGGMVPCRLCAGRPTRCHQTAPP